MPGCVGVYHGLGMAKQGAIPGVVGVVMVELWRLYGVYGVIWVLGKLSGAIENSGAHDGLSGPFQAEHS